MKLFKSVLFHAASGSTFRSYQRNRYLRQVGFFFSLFAFLLSLPIYLFVECVELSKTQHSPSPRSLPLSWITSYLFRLFPTVHADYVSVHDSKLAAMHLSIHSALINIRLLLSTASGHFSTRCHRLTLHAFAPKKDVCSAWFVFVQLTRHAWMERGRRSCILLVT